MINGFSGASNISINVYIKAHFGVLYFYLGTFPSHEIANNATFNGNNLIVTEFVSFSVVDINLDTCYKELIICPT